MAKKEYQKCKKCIITKLRAKPYDKNQIILIKVYLRLAIVSGCQKKNKIWIIKIFKSTKFKFWTIVLEKL